VASGLILLRSHEAQPIVIPHEKVEEKKSEVDVSPHGPVGTNRKKGRARVVLSGA